MPDMFGRPTDKEIKKIGEANPYEKYINVGSYQKGKPGNVGTNRVPYKIENPYYQSPDALNQRQAEAEARQRAFQEQLAAQARATQADIAKQLQIVQQEKSAVSKLSEEYTNLLKTEADAKKKAIEEERIALKTSRANAARAGQGSGLQLQAASKTPTTAGTQQFRRRSDQFKISGPSYGGLGIAQSGMVNV